MTKFVLPSLWASALPFFPKCDLSAKLFVFNVTHPQNLSARRALQLGSAVTRLQTNLRV